MAVGGGGEKFDGVEEGEAAGTAAEEVEKGRRCLVVVRGDRRARERRRRIAMEAGGVQNLRSSSRV